MSSSNHHPKQIRNWSQLSQERMEAKKQPTSDQKAWTTTQRLEIKSNAQDILRDTEKMKTGATRKVLEPSADIFSGAIQHLKEQISPLSSDDSVILKIECGYFTLCLLYISGWLYLLRSVF